MTGGPSFSALPRVWQSREALAAPGTIRNNEHSG